MILFKSRDASRCNRIFQGCVAFSLFCSASVSFADAPESANNSGESSNCLVSVNLAIAPESTKDSAESFKKKPRCTSRKGRVYYKEYGDAMHRYRSPRELTPAEWHTSMLFHRIKVPLTADEYCSLLRFLEKKSGCEEGTCPVVGEAARSEGEKSVSEQMDELREKIEDLKARPSDSFFADSNFLIKGSTHVDFTNTFETGLTPLFLWRWKDKILFELELDFTLINKNLDFSVEYTVINYIASPYLTIRAGKFLLPLGFWEEKMRPEWINKMPNPPLPYVPKDHTVIPPAEIGVEFRGAAPLWRNGWNGDVPVVLVYHAWVGNGPGQSSDGDIDFINNYTDNNNGKAYGGKIGLRPWPFREFAISGMYGQWNNKKHGGVVIAKRKLFYTAIVGELDWHFGAYYRLCGEYMWTKHDAVVNPDIGIFTDEVFVRAAWAQLSGTFDMFKFPYGENFEAVLRYGWVDSDISIDSKRQWSYGLNYYLTDKMIVKFSYDQNMGRANHVNGMTFQWAYGF